MFLLTTKTAFWRINMFRLLKALPLALAIAALIIFAAFAASCGSSNSQARFVNAISDDTQGLDIEFNGTKDFTDVAPFAASGSTYLSVPSGSDKIQGFASGTTTSPVFTATSPVSFNSGSDYTVVATGTLAGSVIILAPVDTNTAPGNGSVNFRVINASLNGPGSVDVYILANPVVPPLGCPTNCPTIAALASPESSTNTTSTYVTLPYNSNGEGYQLYVTVSGQTDPIVKDPSVISVGSVSVGSIRTLVLVDSGTTMSQVPIVLSDLN
jgi:hypothetical protein